MSAYNRYTQPSFDDSYATCKQMFTQFEAEGATWDGEKREVWIHAIRLTAEGLINFYWHGTNPLGFSSRTVKASKTKICELQAILDKLPNPVTKRL